MVLTYARAQVGDAVGLGDDALPPLLLQRAPPHRVAGRCYTPTRSTSANAFAPVCKTIDMREHMEELLLRYQVNAVFAGGFQRHTRRSRPPSRAGHVHAYERSFPIARGRRDEDGIV